MSNDLTQLAWRLGYEDGKRGTWDRDYYRALPDVRRRAYTRGFEAGEAEETEQAFYNIERGPTLRKMWTVFIAVVVIVAGYLYCQDAEAMGSGDQARNCSATADLVKTVATLRDRGYSAGSIQQALAPTPPESLRGDPAEHMDAHQRRQLVAMATQLVFLRPNTLGQELWQKTFDNCLDREAKEGRP